MFFPLYDDNPIDRRPVVTIAIILINLMCLLYMHQQSDYEQRAFRAQHGFVPERLRQINTGQPVRVLLYAPVEIARGGLPVGRQPFVDLPTDTWTVLITTITSLFLHAGWLHLLGNMWFFWIFGDNIEDRLGRVLFLGFYLLGGLIASICHGWMGTVESGFVPVIGASGAVAVVLGAYAVTYPFARVSTFVFLVLFFTVIELPALLVLGFWFVMQLSSALPAFGGLDLDGGVAWWAHIGGFAAGAALMPFMSAGTPEPGHHWDREAQKQFEMPIPRRDEM